MLTQPVTRTLDVDGDTVDRMPVEPFMSPLGSLRLRRPGQSARSPLQAWDGGDRLALEHVAESRESMAHRRERVLVVNDAFGALALALGACPGCRVWSWSDSAIAHAARRNNAEYNGIDPDAVVGLRTVELREEDVPQRFDLAIVKIPKSLALLEHQLCELSAVVDVGTTVVGAGMTRHIHTSTIELFERILGPSRTTLARRKARLILTDVAGDLSPTTSPYPTAFTVDADTVADGTGEGLTVWNHAGVFSQRRLDIGTRFLLESLPPLEESVHVVDLGCGNGAVGSVVARRNREATLTFVDESAAALTSAELTWAAAIGNAADRPVRFVRADAGEGSVEGVDDASVDLVVLNPPFHDQQAVAVAAGRSLIAAAHHVLSPGGRLIVVANRHLGHHMTLRRIFGRAT